MMDGHQRLRLVPFEETQDDFVPDPVDTRGKEPVGEERLEEMLFALILQEERGCVAQLKWSIDLFDPFFETSPHRDLLRCYERLKARVSALIAYEERYGEGALFRPDHPHNKVLIAEGVISADLGKAAKASAEFWRRYKAGGVASGNRLH